MLKVASSSQRKIHIVPLLYNYVKQEYSDRPVVWSSRRSAVIDVIGKMFEVE